MNVEININDMQLFPLDRVTFYTILIVQKNNMRNGVILLLPWISNNAAVMFQWNMPRLILIISTNITLSEEHLNINLQQILAHTLLIGYTNINEICKIKLAKYNRTCITFI